jgi:hypothetical protein
MSDHLYIFLKGNLSEGYEAHGPYPSLDGKGGLLAGHDYEEGWIMVLRQPLVH